MILASYGIVALMLAASNSVYIKHTIIFGVRFL